MCEQCTCTRNKTGGVTRSKVISGLEKCMLTLNLLLFGTLYHWIMPLPYHQLTYCLTCIRLEHEPKHINIPHFKKCAAKNVNEHENEPDLKFQAFSI